MKRLFFLLLTGIILNGCSQQKNIKEEQLEYTLLRTQLIFHQYTSYLNGQDNREKTILGIQLLETMDAQIKTQDSLDPKNNLLGLDYRVSFYDTKPPALSEVYFSSMEYGIAWTVKVDSLLSSINNQKGIIQLKQ